MKISEKVLNILESSEMDGNKLRLTAQLDRKDYLEVNKVLEIIGGKWNKKEKAHIFPNDAFSVVDDVILNGEVTCPKDEFNYFPTPDKVVAKLIELAEIKNGMSVLEPSAGQGAILKGLTQFTGLEITAVEVMDKNYEVLKQSFSPYHFSTKPIQIIKGDFLNFTGKFDRIVMNPPFCKKQEIHHVMHAFGLLKERGVLVSVMSPGVTFRQDYATKQLKDLIEMENGEIHPLASGSFKESGTNVETIIVKLRK
jgi:protein-L-isoaspartate O-methyltransferase